MATLLDLGFLEFFVPLISLVFVFCVLFGILQKTKLLGGKKAIDFFVSLTITILVVLNTQALELAQFMSVWSVVIIIIFVMMVLIFFAFVKEGEYNLPETAGAAPKILFWAFIVILVIGLTQVFGPIFTPYAEDAPKSWVVLRTLFHPRVLGAILILLIVQKLVNIIRD